MKKIFAWLGVVSLLIGLAGCGGGAGDADKAAREGGSNWDEMKWDEGKWG